MNVFKSAAAMRIKGIGVSGIIDAVEGVFSALVSLAQVSIKAFVAILVLIVVGAVIGAVIGASFDVLQATTEGNSVAGGLVEGGRITYDLGSTVQDIYEYARIFAPVIVAVGAVVAAFIILINKFRDQLGF
jgi:hypothetical protein